MVVVVVVLVVVVVAAVVAVAVAVVGSGAGSLVLVLILGGVGIGVWGGVVASSWSSPTYTCPRYLIIFHISAVVLFEASRFRIRQM